MKKEEKKYQAYYFSFFFILNLQFIHLSCKEIFVYKSPSVRDTPHGSIFILQNF